MLPPKYIIVSKTRAKDATRLYKAVEAKLGAQRQFVPWWDGQEKQHGKLGDRPATQFVNRAILDFAQAKGVINPAARAM